MNCEIARDLIQDACDDLLGERGRKMLDAHTADCQACRVHYEQMMGVVAGLDELRELTTLPNLRVGRWSSRGLAGLRIAAAVVVVVTAGMLGKTIFESGEKPPTDVIVATPVAASFEPQLTLQGVSARRLLPVSKPTGDNSVHFIWLYSTPGEADDGAPTDNETSIRERNRAQVLTDASGAGQVGPVTG